MNSNQNSPTKPGACKSFGESHCSHYIPFEKIPKEIYDAATALYIHFEMQGMSEWQFAAVADRRLVARLEYERDEARRIAEAYRDVWEMCSAAVETCPNPDPLPWQDISSANGPHHQQPEENHG